MFDAIIFDWDGTLADTKQIIVYSFQKVLKEVGCEVSNNFLEKQIGIGTRNMFKYVLTTRNIPFEEEMIDILVENKNKIHMESSNRIKLFDGVVILLKTLHAKIKIALATMSNREVINKLLGEKGISEYFDYIITADDVERPKPNPEVFFKCAQALNCLPEKCVVIEDSIFGVIAAKRANMKCIAVSSGAYSKDELKKAEPNLIIGSMKNEKHRILNFIFKENSALQSC